MKKNIFDVQADDSELVSKGVGTFGLHTGNISKFDFEEAESDNGPYKAVNINVSAEGKEFFSKLFLNTVVYGSNNEKLSPEDEGYDAAFYKQYSQTVAVIKQALHSVGVTDEAINASVAGVTNENFIEGIKKMVALVPKNFSSKSIDVFLEYQWEIQKDNTKTFIVLPKKMTGGRFLCPTVTPVGKWEAVISDKGLHYVDNAGNIHPFRRSVSYMESNKAKEQVKGGTNLSQESKAESAKKSIWND